MSLVDVDVDVDVVSITMAYPTAHLSTRCEHDGSSRGVHKRCRRISHGAEGRVGRR